MKVKELWLLPDSEEKVAGRVAVNPGEEMDMWICFRQNIIAVTHII